MHAVSRPEWRKEGNGYLLSKSRFMFMAAFRDKFNDKVVAEMRGVIDEHGYSPFWQSLGKRFRWILAALIFSAAPGKRHLLQN